MQINITILFAVAIAMMTVAIYAMPQPGVFQIQGPEETFPAPTVEDGKESAPGEIPAIVRERYGKLINKHEDWPIKRFEQCSKGEKVVYILDIAEGFGAGEVYYFSEEGGELYYRLCDTLPSDGCKLLEERGARPDLSEYVCVSIESLLATRPPVERVVHPEISLPPSPANVLRWESAFSYPGPVSFEGANGAVISLRKATLEGLADFKLTLRFDVKAGYGTFCTASLADYALRRLLDESGNVDYPKAASSSSCAEAGSTLSDQEIYFENIADHENQFTILVISESGVQQGFFALKTLDDKTISVKPVEFTLGVVPPPASAPDLPAKDLQRAADLRQVQNFLGLYFEKCGYYPGPRLTPGQPCPLFSPAPDYPTMRNALLQSSLGVSAIPEKDPYGKNYGYSASSDGRHYVLGAYLDVPDNDLLKDDIDGTTSTGFNCGYGTPETPPIYCVGF